MRTLLDAAHSWLLESLSYEEELLVTVVELFRNDASESLTVGGQTIDGLHALAPTTRSRRLTVRFVRIVAWQVVNESYTAFDKSEQRDDGRFLHMITHSAYLTYVEANHGWFTAVAGPAHHYRLWTEDEVVDVVAHQVPVVEPWTP
jgi:hypothetical protein